VRTNASSCTVLKAHHVLTASSLNLYVNSHAATCGTQLYLQINAYFVTRVKPFVRLQDLTNVQDSGLPLKNAHNSNAIKIKLLVKTNGNHTLIEHAFNAFV
jgi:hypothetical protein